MKSKEEFNAEMEEYLNKYDDRTLTYKILEYITWSVLLTFPFLGVAGYIINNDLFKALGIISYILWAIIIYRIIMKK